MEFDRNRVFTTVNADELKPGDKVIVADTLQELRGKVAEGTDVRELSEVLIETSMRRFCTDFSYVNEDRKDACFSYTLAYLVERAENCTNCVHQGEYLCSGVKKAGKDERVHRCEDYKPKTEKKCSNCLMNEVCSEKVKELYKDAPCPYFRTENKKYRPFKGCDELIKVWGEKIGSTDYWGKGADLVMPHIWVQDKENDVGIAQHLITDFNVTRLNEDNDEYETGITVNCEDITFNDLFDRYEFLDGSICGVEE